MKYSQRVLKLLAQEAPRVGGLDADGREWPQDPVKQRKHLYYVKNRDIEHAHGDFVLGHVIVPLIVDDCYDIEYLGLHEHSYPPKEGEEMTKEHKKTFERVQKLKERQEREIADAEQARLEEQGIFA